jgi:uncharacterized protein YkvS
MMKKVVMTTDSKHVGDTVDSTADVIEFADGETMQVEKRLADNRVLSNSNYVIILED